MFWTPRLRAVAAIVFAYSGLSKLDFARLAPEAPRPTCKTVDHYVLRAARNRYTGEALRAIRANGQHRERQRRLGRLQAVAA